MWLISLLLSDDAICDLGRTHKPLQLHQHGHTAFWKVYVLVLHLAILGCDVSVKTFFFLTVSSHVNTRVTKPRLCANLTRGCSSQAQGPHVSASLGLCPLGQLCGNTGLSCCSPVFSSRASLAACFSCSSFQTILAPLHLHINFRINVSVLLGSGFSSLRR